MVRKIATPVILLIVVSVHLYTLTSVVGFISRANAESQTVLLHQEWVFAHSVIDETTVQHFTFDNAAGKKIVLQRLDDEKWIDLYEHQFEKDEAGVQTIPVEIESPSEKGIVQYRIVSSEYNVHNPFFGFSVENHDPADYSDYIKQAYDEIKSYCGNVFITEGNKEEMELKNAVGFASAGLNKIQIYEGMDTETVKWVANHECGHILQHRAYDKDRESYPISEKRSILWLNDELTPFYDEKYKNDRGTGFSEKNADCIASYISSDPSRFYAECIGNKGQAVYNIVNGHTASKTLINENLTENVRLDRTGFAVSEVICYSESYCIQEFEYGSAIWQMKDGTETFGFITRNGLTYEDGHFFYPSLFSDYGENSTESLEEGFANFSNGE